MWVREGGGGIPAGVPKGVEVGGHRLLLHRAKLRVFVFVLPALAGGVGVRHLWVGDPVHHVGGVQAAPLLVEGQLLLVRLRWNQGLRSELVPALVRTKLLDRSLRVLRNGQLTLMGFQILPFLRV